MHRRRVLRLAALVALIALGIAAIQLLRRDSRQDAVEPGRDGAETEQPSLEGPQLVGRPARPAPVSYTHLTLPTILRV